MDTKTGEIIQVVEAGGCSPADMMTELTNKVMTQQEVTDENARREAAGESPIVKIAKTPKPNCRRCHGRGHIGRDIKTNTYVPCVCVLSDEEAKARRQRLDWEEIQRRRFGQK